MSNRNDPSSRHERTVCPETAPNIIALILTSILSLRQTLIIYDSKIEPVIKELLKIFSNDVKRFIVAVNRFCYGQANEVSSSRELAEQKPVVQSSSLLAVQEETQLDAIRVTDAVIQTTKTVVQVGLNTEGHAWRGLLLKKLLKPDEIEEDAPSNTEGKWYATHLKTGIQSHSPLQEIRSSKDISTATDTEVILLDTKNEIQFDTSIKQSLPIPLSSQLVNDFLKESHHSRTLKPYTSGYVLSEAKEENGTKNTQTDTTKMFSDFSLCTATSVDESTLVDQYTIFQDGVCLYKNLSENGDSFYSAKRRKYDTPIPFKKLTKEDQVRPLVVQVEEERYPKYILMSEKPEKNLSQEKLETISKQPNPVSGKRLVKSKSAQASSHPKKALRLGSRSRPESSNVSDPPKDLFTKKDSNSINENQCDDKKSSYSFGSITETLINPTQNNLLTFDNFKAIENLPEDYPLEDTLTLEEKYSQLDPSINGKKNVCSCGNQTEYRTRILLLKGLDKADIDLRTDYTTHLQKGVKHPMAFREQKDRSKNTEEISPYIKQKYNIKKEKSEATIKPPFPISISYSKSAELLNGSEDAVDKSIQVGERFSYSDNSDSSFNIDHQQLSKDIAINTLKAIKDGGFRISPTANSKVRFSVIINDACIKEECCEKIDEASQIDESVDRISLFENQTEDNLQDVSSKLALVSEGMIDTISVVLEENGNEKLYSGATSVDYIPVSDSKSIESSQPLQDLFATEGGNVVDEYTQVGENRESQTEENLPYLSENYSSLSEGHYKMNMRSSDNSDIKEECGGAINKSLQTEGTVVSSFEDQTEDKLPYLSENDSLVRREEIFTPSSEDKASLKKTEENIKNSSSKVTLMSEETEDTVSVTTEENNSERGQSDTTSAESVPVSVPSSITAESSVVLEDSSIKEEYNLMDKNTQVEKGAISKILLSDETDLSLVEKEEYTTSVGTQNLDKIDDDLNEITNKLEHDRPSNNTLLVGSENFPLDTTEIVPPSTTIKQPIPSNSKFDQFLNCWLDCVKKETCKAMHEYAQVEACTIFEKGFCSCSSQTKENIPLDTTEKKLPAATTEQHLLSNLKPGENSDLWQECAKREECKAICEDAEVQACTIFKKGFCSCGRQTEENIPPDNSENIQPVTNPHQPVLYCLKSGVNSNLWLECAKREECKVIGKDAQVQACTLFKKGFCTCDSQMHQNVPPDNIEQIQPVTTPHLPVLCSLKSGENSNLWLECVKKEECDAMDAQVEACSFFEKGFCSCGNQTEEENITYTSESSSFSVKSDNDMAAVTASKDLYEMDDDLKKAEQKLSGLSETVTILSDTKEDKTEVNTKSTGFFVG